MQVFAQGDQPAAAPSLLIGRQALLLAMNLSVELAGQTCYAEKL
jgi:hypothetical protein